MTGSWFPSYAQLAEVSNETTAKRTMRKARDFGYIDFEDNHGGRNRRNDYQLKGTLQTGNGVASGPLGVPPADPHISSELTQCSVSFGNSPADAVAPSLSASLCVHALRLNRYIHGKPISAQRAWGLVNLCLQTNTLEQIHKSLMVWRIVLDTTTDPIGHLREQLELDPDCLDPIFSSDNLADEEPEDEDAEPDITDDDDEYIPF